MKGFVRNVKFHTSCWGSNPETSSPQPVDKLTALSRLCYERVKRFQIKAEDNETEMFAM